MKSNNKIKNLKIVGAGLCLGAVLLVGCGDVNTPLTNSDVVIEDGKMMGIVSYKDLSNFGKVVIFKNSSDIEPCLLIKTEEETFAMYGQNYVTTRYTDFETGTVLIEYRDYKNNNFDRFWIVGENLEISSEEDFVTYLLSNGFKKDDYTVDEVLSFFNEKVLPTFKTGNKEMVK